MMKNSFNSQNRKSDIHFAELYLKRFSLPFSRTNLHASSVVISESLAHHNNISIIILCLSRCMYAKYSGNGSTHTLARAQHQQQSLFRFIHFRISVAHLCVSGEIVLGYSVHDHHTHTQPVQTSATHTDAHS